MKEQKRTMRLLPLMVVTLIMSGSVVWGACNISGAKGEINVIMNSFPVLEVISDELKTCSSGDLKVTTKLTSDHREETIESFGSSASYYDVAQGSGSSIIPLKTEGLVENLNDLVKKYKSTYEIEDRMLIKENGNIIAIAFQVNSQHLFYRKDLLEKHKIKPPKTYKELLRAAKKLQKEGSIDFPLGGTYKQGWNLATEFVNIYLGMGGEFFKGGSAEPSIANAKGARTLKLMKELLKYMSPDALTQDTSAVTQSFQQGRIAMANLWGSRASAMDDDKQSKVVDKIGFVSAPKISSNGVPATALWWDGFFLAKNMDGDKDLAFRVMMEGLKSSVVKDNNDIAVWIRSNYNPTKYAVGVIATVDEKAKPYPSQPYFGLLHGEIGNSIADYLTGKESDKKVLKKIEAAYRKTAKEKGFL